VPSVSGVYLHCISVLDHTIDLTMNFSAYRSNSKLTKILFLKYFVNSGNEIGNQWQLLNALVVFDLT